MSTPTPPPSARPEGDFSPDPAPAPATGARFASFLSVNHGLTPDDVTPAETPGYWHVKEPCPGGARCRHAFRGALGPCRGGGTLGVHFAEHGRDEGGRFLRPHREWERQRAALAAAAGA